MKIEIGESLIYSWLKHVKNCHIVQTNWKVSSNWERENSVHDKVMDLFQTLKKDMEFSDVFKTELDQTLKQAETDVIGLDSNNNVYFVDSAFHESGLTYGSKLETKNRVFKKLLRAYLTALEFFPDRNYKIIFASPKVIHGTKKIITDYFEVLNSRYGNEKVLFEFYADETFRDEILLPTLKKTENEADTAELFLRSCKMLDMFNLIKKTENKTITSANYIEKQKKEILDSSTDNDVDDETKRKKSDAINLCKKYIADTDKMNSDNTTFASKNATVETYWANPNIKLLNQDWWLLLNDTKNKKLHIFFIPANSISRNKVKLKADNSFKINLQIIYDDKMFTDGPSSINFYQWYKDTIPFG